MDVSKLQILLELKTISLKDTSNLFLIFYIFSKNFLGIVLNNSCYI